MLEGDKAAPQARAGLDAQRFQELWLALARTPWKSLALVPVDPDGSSAEVAAGLADAGSQLSDGQVVVVAADPLDSSPSSNKALASRVASMRQGRGASQLLVALAPVIVQPLGAVIARRADAAVLCVRLGRSRLADTRRTIALIGEERVAGAIVVG